jgi:hypothetical protein
MIQIKVVDITRSAFQVIYQLFSVWCNFWERLLFLIKTSCKNWGNTGLIWTKNLPANFARRPPPPPSNKFHWNLLSSLWDDTWRQIGIMTAPLWFHCMHFYREWIKTGWKYSTVLLHNNANFQAYYHISLQV